MAKDRTMKTTIEIAGDLDDSLKKVFEQASKQLDDLTEKAKKTEEASKRVSDGFTVMKGALSNLVADGIRAAGNGLRDLAGSVVETGMDFTSTMSEVQAISGATGDELSLLEETAREYGATTVFSASEAGDALKYMALAGWDVQQSTDALGGVLDLAASSGMDLAEASDMVTDYLSAFGMEAKESSYLADLLAYSQSHANTSAQQLGEAFGNAAANMNAAGQDVETTTSLLAMMANQGFKGSEAGTALSAMMRDMTASMKDGAVKIGDTSVAIMDAHGNYRDMTDILLDVQAATEGMGDAERSVALSGAFTAKSIKGVNLLLNAGAENAADFEEQLRKSGGTAGDMADTMTDNLGGDLKAMGSGFEELQLKIYDGMEEPMRGAVQYITGSVIPKLTDLVNTALPVFQSIADGVGPALEAVVGFAEGGIKFVGDNIDWLVPLVVGLTGAFAAYKAMSFGVATIEAIKTAALATGTTVTSLASAATWALGAAMSFLTSPIFLVSAAIGAVIAAGVLLYRNWDTVKEKAGELGDKLDAIWSTVTGAVTNMIDIVGEKFPLFGGFLNGWWQSISDVVGSVKGIFTGVIDFIDNVFAGNWSGAWDSIVDIFGNVFGAIVGIAKAPINGVIGVINGAIDSINGIGFDIPDWVPLIGGKKFSVNIPNLPMLGTGGFTAGPSIAGEAGTEAVISFNQRYREQNLSYWAKAGQMLGAAPEDFSLSGSYSGTTIEIGDINFSPEIKIQGDAKKSDVMEAIRESYPEFMDMLEEFFAERGDVVYV